MTFVRLALLLAAAAAVQFTPVKAAAQSLDFETYRTQVEPVFLKKRPGHARCVVCHEASNSAFRLQPLAEGSSAWTEEQSRLNFENVSHLVVAGKPNASKLLMHPLAPDAGGDRFHGGGRQFSSENDPEWQAVAAWVSAGK